MKLRPPTLLFFAMWAVACGTEPSSDDATSQVRADTGWFHLESTTELYDVPRSTLDLEVVEMAGGPVAVTARGAAHLEAREPVEALHFSDMVLNADLDDSASLRVRLDALRALLEASGEVNDYETWWLRDQIEKTRKAAGM